VATLTTKLLPSGVRSLKAFYSGDATYQSSVSTTLSQAVAAIASRAHVIEIEPQVWTLGNRNLVVCMKMAVTAVEAVAKLGQHSIGRRVTEASLPERFDDIRLPGAVNAAPTVALKTKYAQPAMVSIVSALGGRTASYVVFTLTLAAVGLAGSAGSQFGTSRERAWTHHARACRDRPRDHAAPLGKKLGCINLVRDNKISFAPTKTSRLANRWRFLKRERKCS